MDPEPVPQAQVRQAKGGGGAGLVGVPDSEGSVDFGNQRRVGASDEEITEVISVLGGVPPSLVAAELEEIYELFERHAVLAGDGWVAGGGGRDGTRACGGRGRRIRS